MLNRYAKWCGAAAIAATSLALSQSAALAGSDGGGCLPVAVTEPMSMLVLAASAGGLYAIRKLRAK